MTDISESLLTEILLHAQNLHASVEEFKVTLSQISKDLNSLEKKVDDIIEAGFVDKDLKAHKKWHQKRQGKRFFLF